MEPNKRGQTSRAEPLLVTVQTASEMLGISRAKTFNMIASGELPSVLLGPQTRRVEVAEIRALIERRKAENAAAVGKREGLAETA